MGGGNVYTWHDCMYQQLYISCDIIVDCMLPNHG